MTDQSFGSVTYCRQNDDENPDPGEDASPAFAIGGSICAYQGFGESELSSTGFSTARFSPLRLRWNGDATGQRPLLDRAALRVKSRRLRRSGRCQ
jgi:hypothetical protein